MPNLFNLSNSSSSNLYASSGVPVIRPRRLRSSDGIRALVRETYLKPEDFIYPIFVVEGMGIKKEIKSLEGQYHWSVDKLSEIIDQVCELGIRAVLLFGLPDENLKDECGSGSFLENGVVQQAIREIKKIAPELVVMTDVCLCSYTHHGHCGPLKLSTVDNDETLKILGKMAVSHAKAGADFVAPSGMMDGMVSAIRDALDHEGLSDAGILSYSVKYASSFYGPFRDAAKSSFSSGDRKSYQMDPANRREALKEAQLDVEQGADMLMVKPALAYLDIISDLRANFDLPIAAYHVSGEFMMIKAAGKLGLLDADQAMLESLIGIKRAGADLIISYAALEIAKKIK
jgi:porphobilinogen synthase